METSISLEKIIEQDTQEKKGRKVGGSVTPGAFLAGETLTAEGYTVLLADCIDYLYVRGHAAGPLGNIRPPAGEKGPASLYRLAVAVAMDTGE